MRRLILLLLATSILAPQCKAAITTVYLVRHAEKQSNADDSGLTEDGKARAEQLASVLRSTKLSACFASQFKRTQDTAVPTAKSQGLKVTQRNAGKEAVLAKELKESFAGKNILFVGHSNTVPNLMKQLGASGVPKLAEADYDSLFVVQIDDSGQATFMRLHFGQPPLP